MGQFRFQDLKIWQRGADVGLRLFRLADFLDENKKYRFAEQLRAAALSISNNIAKGSGAASNKDFAKFVSIARKSTFECASMMIMFQRDKRITSEPSRDLRDQLEQLSRMQHAFIKKLRDR